MSIDNVTNGFETVVGADQNVSQSCATSETCGGTNGKTDAGTNNAWRDFMVADVLTATAVVDEWETQSQADPTGFHVNVMEKVGAKYKIADTTGNWATAGTWSDGVVPSAGDNIIIRNGVDVDIAANLDLGTFGTLEVQGNGTLDIDADKTVATVPRGWVISENRGTVTNNYGTITLNYEGTVTTNHYSGTITNNYYGTITNNYGTVRDNSGTVATNYYGIVVTNYSMVTSNNGVVEINSGTVATNNGNGIVLHNYGTIGTDNGESDVPRVTLVDTTTTNTDMKGTDGANTTVPDAAGTAPTAIENRQEMDSNSAGLTAIYGDTQSLVARITATLFAGITSLAEWLGLIAGKQVGDATARTELRATGVGSGTFDETTDSGEATVDRGNTAWPTATGFAVPGSAMALVDAEDVYHADIQLTIDEANPQDEYTVIWHKNGVAITSGITVPKIQVVKRADGTDLIANTAMTEIGATETFKYDSPAARVTAGEAVVAVATATIDAATRTWKRVLGRDSE